MQICTRSGSLPTERPESRPWIARIPAAPPRLALPRLFGARRLVVLALLSLGTRIPAAPVAEGTAGARPPDARRTATWNRSWIGFDYAPLTGKLVEGDVIGVTLDYYLDPAEHFGSTSLVLQALGPRVPRADRPKPTHLWYGQHQVEIQPGPGSYTFNLRVLLPESIGNLLVNGGSEDENEDAPDGTMAAHWRGTGAERISAAGLGIGLGKKATV